VVVHAFGGAGKVSMVGRELKDASAWMEVDRSGSLLVASS
jgi:hypothetical protein